MSEEATNYGVSYIADVPEDFKKGDSVEIIKAPLYLREIIGSKGVISDCDDGYATVKLSGEKGFTEVTLPTYSFRKLPDAIHFDDAQDDSKCINPSSVPSENDSPVERFNKMAADMVSTYAKKNADYGDAYADGYKRFGAMQLVSRIYEKYCRVENLLVRNVDKKVTEETVADTLTDMAVQCLVLRMLIEK